LATAISLGTTALGINASDISTQGRTDRAGCARYAITTVNRRSGSIGAAQAAIGFALDNAKTAIASTAAGRSATSTWRRK
jgi:hypothetical protein